MLASDDAIDADVHVPRLDVWVERPDEDRTVQPVMLPERSDEPRHRSCDPVGISGTGVLHGDDGSVGSFEFVVRIDKTDTIVANHQPIRSGSDDTRDARTLEGATGDWDQHTLPVRRRASDCD